jgi:hypothetical protein
VRKGRIDNLLAEAVRACWIQGSELGRCWAAADLLAEVSNMDGQAFEPRIQQLDGFLLALGKLVLKGRLVSVKI